MKSVLLIVMLLSPVVLLAQGDNRALLETTNKNIALFMEKRDYKSAAREAEKAIDISKAVFGENAREVAIAYENLGLILAAGDKHKQAVDPLRKALEIFQMDPKRNGRDIAGTMQKLGDALSRFGQRKEAETLFNDAGENAKQVFGEGSKEHISAKAASGCFYLSSKQVSKAFNEFVESYAAALVKYGRDSAELDHVALTCEGGFLDDLWKNQGDINKARSRLDQLLGYEMGRPTKVARADYDIRWSDIGRKDAEISFAVVKVWVDETGKPTDAKMIYGSKRHVDLAVSAARDSKFKPSVRNGTAIPDVMYIYYSFIR